MPRHESGLLRVSLFVLDIRRSTRQTVGKCPISQMSTNPVPDSSTRTQANTTSVPPPQEDSDDVSVMNSEVESVMNHRRLKEAMRAPALSEQEFTALSSIDAYIRAAQDGLARVIQLFSKKIQVKFDTILHGHIPVAPET